MTSTYVVTVETSAADDQDYKFVEERLGEEEVKVHDKLKRDDGTAIYWLDWQPHPERYIEDGEWVTPTASANTWDAAKSSIEHIRSTFAGAGLLVVECRVEEYELSKDDAKKTEAKAKKDRAAAEKALDQKADEVAKAEEKAAKLEKVDAQAAQNVRDEAQNSGASDKEQSRARSAAARSRSQDDAPGSTGEPEVHQVKDGKRK